MGLIIILFFSRISWHTVYIGVFICMIYYVHNTYRESQFNKILYRPLRARHCGVTTYSDTIIIIIRRRIRIQYNIHYILLLLRCESPKYNYYPSHAACSHHPRVRRRFCSTTLVDSDRCDEPLFLCGCGHVLYSLVYRFRVRNKK